MRRKIPCSCENAFEVEVPEEINLDTDPAYLDQILKGSFFNFECPSCGKNNKPEFPLLIQWPSKKLSFEVFQELDRGEFYRRKKSPSKKKPNILETIISYPEMAERLSVIRDGFEPAAVEAIKYYLYLKADEQYPDDELEIWYFGSRDDTIEFHIHGIKKDEVAVMKIPFSLYKKTLDDYKKHPKNEIFSALRHKTYLSVKNTMRNEALK